MKIGIPDLSKLTEVLDEVLGLTRQAAADAHAAVKLQEEMIELLKQLLAATYSQKTVIIRDGAASQPWTWPNYPAPTWYTTMTTSQNDDVVIYNEGEEYSD